MGKKMNLAFRLGQTESPLWSLDAKAKAEFGQNITDFSKLRLKPKLILQVSSLASLDQSRANPIHSFLPSLWSGEMCVFYQQFTIHVFTELEARFRKFYEMKNDEHSFMNSKIKVSEINANLKTFLEDPTDYVNKNGIKIGKTKDLNSQISEAYDLWFEIEQGWI